MHAPKEATAYLTSRNTARAWVHAGGGATYRIEAESQGSRINLDVFNVEGSSIGQTLQFQGQGGAALPVWLAHNGMRVVAHALNTEKSYD